MATWKKIALGLGGLVFLLVLGVVIAGVVANEPRPEGTPGPEADALARKAMDAVGADAWARVGAVSWHFGGRNQHLWDRQRNLAHVRFDDAEVWVDLTTRKGVAKKGGQPVADDEANALVRSAIARWINDAFWLNPIAKFFDEGVRRQTVTTPDGPALLIDFGEVGQTPGDAYLWHFGPDGKPTRWQMWVSIIPIGGLGATWTGWIDVGGGAMVSTEHDIGGFLPLQLSEVKAAGSLAELVPGDDPFAPLLAQP